MTPVRQHDSRLACRVQMETTLHQKLVVWLLPSTWRCVAEFRRINLQPLWTSFLALILPPTAICLLGSTHSTLIFAQEKTTTGTLIGQNMWLNPWTVAFLWKASVTLAHLRQAQRHMFAIRADTCQSAWDCLAAELSAGRACRTSQYDIYLPPTGSDQIKTKRPILFFPGAGCEHTAYAEPASHLAAAGYWVVVISAEPLRLVNIHCMSVARIRSICAEIEARYLCGKDWILAGHSMGSFICTKLAPPLHVRHIVLWGSGTCQHAAPKCSIVSVLPYSQTKCLTYFEYDFPYQSPIY